MNDDSANNILKYSKTQNIDSNLIGWFLKTVLNYERPIKAFRKDNFNNFQHRTYDMEVLEKKLLENSYVNTNESDDFEQPYINRMLKEIRN
ncbi:hypothetical protein JK636_18570 [Clostridium sp. YIM B02515]|uniref:Uncharacterized protein n=1 Tax=Clostridium rhizosphaerae TaxID=2803861 RepID=A0ABS1TH91_9CLOT|nr:hypothetical protein [Clostridium rhizosphaerae]MBL4937714.1 hypothetical protein [Clostridium rhizosphaerae]